MPGEIRHPKNYIVARRFIRFMESLQHNDHQKIYFSSLMLICTDSENVYPQFKQQDGWDDLTTYLYSERNYPTKYIKLRKRQALRNWKLVRIEIQIHAQSNVAHMQVNFYIGLVFTHCDSIIILFPYEVLNLSNCFRFAAVSN